MATDLSLNNVAPRILEILRGLADTNFRLVQTVLPLEGAHIKSLVFAARAVLRDVEASRPEVR